MSRQLHVTLGHRGGKSFAAHTGSDHDIPVDASIPHGGLQQGADPEELLLIALAASIGMEVLAQLESGGHKAPGYRVEVRGSADDGRPLNAIALEHVVAPDGVAAGPLEQAIQQASSSPSSVAAVLAAGVKLTHTVRVEAAGQAPGAQAAGGTAQPQDWFR